MSQLLDRGSATADAGPRRHDAGPTRRLALSIVALALLLGAVAGWTAFAVFSPTGPSQRSLDAQRARWEGIAEETLERAEAEAKLGVDRQRWEGQADRYAPGWVEAR
jgi:hypothetical protein